MSFVDEDDSLLGVHRRSSSVTTTITPQKSEKINIDNNNDINRNALRLFSSLSFRGAGSAYCNKATEALQTSSLNNNNNNNSSKGIDISSLPWNSLSSDERRCKIFTKMEATCCNTIITNDAMRIAFETFISEKRLLRKCDDGKTFFQDPPRLTHDDIKCISDQSLREYQIAGVQFLLDNFCHGLSSILADDMGLGKTAQICSFLQVLFTFYNIQGPHLLVVPLTSLSSWMRELGRWAPSLTLLKYHGTKSARRDSGLHSVHRHSVVVTTPSILLSDRGVLRKRAWVTVVVDEAHLLKNDSTNIVALCSRMSAAMRLAVTGTPIQNKVRELWTQMTFLYPFLIDKRNTVDEDDVLVKNATALLAFIMLRRTKSSLDLGLPPRIDEPTLMIEPTPLQQLLLDTLSIATTNNSDENINYNGGSLVKRSVISRFMDLRKLCNHPLQLQLLADVNRARVRAEVDRDETNNYNNNNSNYYSVKTLGLARLKASDIPLTSEYIVLPSAKMIKLDLMLQELKQQGHRVLIFSNFTSQLDLIEGLCSMRGYSYERLDGDCHRIERELSMIRYNAHGSNIFTFLLTTTAGGVGVTLTGADTVILYDCHYNPQIDRQAADRAHRIGQTRPVHVYRMCLKGTAEEKIQAIAARKAAIGDLVIDGKEEDGGMNNNGNEGKSEAKFFSIEEMRALLYREHASRRQKQQICMKATNSISLPCTNNNNTTMMQLDDENDVDDVSEEKPQQAVTNAGDVMTTETMTATAVAVSAADYEAAASQKSQELIHTAANESSWEVVEALLCDKLVQLIIKDGKESETVGKSRQLPGEGGNSRSSRNIMMKQWKRRSNICFACDRIMRPLEPLVRCTMCPKGYHPDCIDTSPGQFWSCERHLCNTCGKSGNTDGGLFMCSGCPRSYCVDCLDPRYHEISDDGLSLRHLSRRYPEMDEDGVEVRQSTYYITCLHCAAVANSSDISRSGGMDNNSSSDDDDTVDEDSSDSATKNNNHSKKSKETNDKIRNSNTLLLDE